MYSEWLGRRGRHLPCWNDQQVIQPLSASGQSYAWGHNWIDATVAYAGRIITPVTATTGKHTNANEHLSHSIGILSSSICLLWPLSLQRPLLAHIKTHTRNVHLWVGCLSIPDIYLKCTVQLLSYTWNVLPTDLGNLLMMHINAKLSADIHL